jgi:hypothetical protein
MDILEHRYWCCRSLFGKFIVKVMTYCCSIEIHIFLFHLFHNFFSLLTFLHLFHCTCIHDSVSSISSNFSFHYIFTFCLQYNLHISVSLVYSWFCFTNIRRVMWAIAITWRLSSVRKHFNLLLENHWSKLDQTWQECSFAWSNQVLLLSLRTVIQHGCQGP